MLKLLSFKHLVRTTAYLRHVPSLSVSGVWKSVYHAAKQQQLTNNRCVPITQASSRLLQQTLQPQTTLLCRPRAPASLSVLDRPQR